MKLVCVKCRKFLHPNTLLRQAAPAAISRPRGRPEVAASAAPAHSSSGAVRVSIRLSFIQLLVTCSPVEPTLHPFE
jgi:hypothetical protein